MKKVFAIGVTVLATLSLAACGNSSSSDSSSKPEKATKVDASKESSKKAASSSKAAEKSAAESIPTTADQKWFFSKDKNVFYAGNETMTLTKSEVRDGVDDGTKVLVLYCDILNNSKEEQDPSNFYMVIHAKQKTDTSNVTLDPGMLKTNDDGTSPLQAQEDALNASLLPGKKISTVMMWELKNTSPVSVEFEDADFSTLGSKEYSVQ